MGIWINNVIDDVYNGAKKLYTTISEKTGTKVERFFSKEGITLFTTNDVDNYWPTRIVGQKFKIVTLGDKARNSTRFPKNIFCKGGFDQYMLVENEGEKFLYPFRNGRMINIGNQGKIAYNLNNADDMHDLKQTIACFMDDRW